MQVGFTLAQATKALRESRVIARAERDGTRAETRFRPSPKRTSPFKSVGTSVQSTAGSRGVRISFSNAGYAIFGGGVRVLANPLHQPVSSSLPLQCVTVCHQVPNELYSSTLFLISALEGGERSASRPGRNLPPGKTRYTLYRRLGGPQGRSGQVRKIWPPHRDSIPGPSSLQAVAIPTELPGPPLSNVNPVNICNAQRITSYINPFNPFRVFTLTPKLNFRSLLVRKVVLFWVFSKSPNPKVHE